MFLNEEQNLQKFFTKKTNYEGGKHGSERREVKEYKKEREEVINAKIKGSKRKKKRKNKKEWS